MKKIILVLLAASTMYASKAQQDSTMTEKRPIPSMARVKTTDGKVLKGWLYNINDSQVVLLDKIIRYPKIPDWGKAMPLYPVRADQIESMSLRKKNSVSKGFWIGLGTGILTGAVIGFISGDDPPCDPNEPDFIGLGYALCSAFRQTAFEKALTGAVGLGTVGGLTGIILGSVIKKKFIIGGKKQKFRDLDAELRQRLLIK